MKDLNFDVKQEEIEEVMSYFVNNEITIRKSLALLEEVRLELLIQKTQVAVNGEIHKEDIDASYIK